MKMNMKGKIRRGLGIAMTIIMSSFFLAGCGKDKDKAFANKPAENDNILSDASTQSKDYVYRSEEFDIEGLDLTGLYPSNLKMINDRIYCYAYYSSTESDIVSFNLDGSDAKCVNLPSEQGDYYNSVDITSDGGFVACHFIPQGDNEDPLKELVKIDKDGKIVETYGLESEDTEAEDFLIHSIIVLDDDSIVLSTNRGIESFSFNEGFKTVISKEKYTGKASISGLLITKGCSGKIYGIDSEKVYDIDLDKGAVSEGIEAFNNGSIKFGKGTDRLLTGYGEYELYLETDQAIYGYSVENNTVDKLMDYVDSNIDLSSGSCLEIVATSDNEFIAMIPDYNYNFSVVKLTKVPADQVKDQKILTLATASPTPRLKDCVTKFNKENDGYKIKLVDYSKYDTDTDWYAGQNKLDMDIVSGNVPDIMCFSPGSEAKYIEKGLLYDLKPFLDKDNEYSEDDILPNVIDAMTTDGKMYTLIDGFNVATFATKKSYLKDRKALNINECESIMKEQNAPHEIAFGYMTNDTMLADGIVFGDNHFVDYKNKKCSFDSKEFIELLEFAGKFPTEFNGDKYDREIEVNYRKGIALFEEAYIEGFRRYACLKQGVFGDDLVLVNPFGSGDPILYPTSQLAISSQTEYPEAAWEFIKQMWNDDYQNNKLYELPVTKKGFESCVQYAMEEPYEMVNGEKKPIDDMLYIGNEAIKLKPLTREEVGYVKDIVLSAHKATSVGEKIGTIITEEASAYFAGQKTAEEVAKIIQSRASICVSENG